MEHRRPIDRISDDGFVHDLEFRQVAGKVGGVVYCRVGRDFLTNRPVFGRYEVISSGEALGLKRRYAYDNCSYSQWVADDRWVSYRSRDLMSDDPGAGLAGN